MTRSRRLLVLAAVAIISALCAPLSGVTARAAADPPDLSTVSGGGLFHELTDPRAVLPWSYSGKMVLGPDGRPWFSPGSDLYSIAKDESLVKHPLPGDGDFFSGVQTIQTASDGSLWLMGPGGMVRVTADGAVNEVAALPKKSGSSFSVTGDARAVVFGIDWATRGEYMAWVSPDGTTVSYPLAGYGDELPYPTAGPAGSVWGMRSDGKGYDGVFPDGHRVRLTFPAGVTQLDSLKFSGGTLFATYKVDDVQTIARVEVDGTLTPLVTAAGFSVIQDGEVVWSTNDVGGGVSFHRTGDPSWTASLPSTYRQSVGGCWQPRTSTLWIVATPVSGNGFQSVLEVSANGVVPRLSGSYYSVYGCESAPDGTLWASIMANMGFSEFFRVSADGSQVTYGGYGPGTSGPWVVTDDGVWMPAASLDPDAGITAAIGHLSFAATDRVAGADRFGTAAQISQKAFPSGAPIVYLASGLDFPDALAAGPAAAKSGGPLLLTAPWTLPAATAAELKRLAPGKIVLVGGSNAVSAAVESQVHAAVPGATVERRAGGNRYVTADDVVSGAFTSAATVYVATGRTFPDALSASAAAGSAGDPVVLVEGGASTVPDETAQLIARLHPSAVTVVGGPDVVSDAILNQLNAIAPATRVAGSDRFATAAQVAKTVFPHATHAYLANGTTFPDALAGAVLAASTRSPLVTSRAGCLDDGTEGALLGEGVGSITLLGGDSVLNDFASTLKNCTFEPWAQGF